MNRSGLGPMLMLVAGILLVAVLAALVGYDAAAPDRARREADEARVLLDQEWERELMRTNADIRARLRRIEKTTETLTPTGAP